MMADAMRDECYMERDGHRRGPFTIAEAGALIAAGLVPLASQVVNRDGHEISLTERGSGDTGAVVAPPPPPERKSVPADAPYENADRSAGLKSLRNVGSDVAAWLTTDRGLVVSLCAAGIIAVVLMIWWLGLAEFVRLIIGFAALCGILHVLERKRIKMHPAIAALVGFVILYLSIGWKPSGPIGNFIQKVGDGLRSKTSVQRPAVGEFPSVKEISAAFEPYFYHVGTTCTRHTQSLLGEQVTPDGTVASGVLLANDSHHGLILTNRHVIDPEYFAEANGDKGVRFSGVQVYVQSSLSRTPIAARVVAVHREWDLAVLLVEKHFDTLRAVRLANTSKVGLGDPVVAFGNPLNLGVEVRGGKVSSESTDVVKHTCQIDPGFSGGPLILQKRGLLIGINTLFVGRGGNYAIPVDVATTGLRQERASHQSFAGTQGWIWHLDSSNARDAVRDLMSKVEVTDAR